MGKGKSFKSKPTGTRSFSMPEDILTSHKHKETLQSSESESESESEEENRVRRRKGLEGLIEIENPNLIKPKTLKARDIDMDKTPELSRREREEIEKQRAAQRYQKLEEEGKTEKARMDLERLALIRQQRAEAVRKRDEEKAAKEEKARKAAEGHNTSRKK